MELVDVDGIRGGADTERHPLSSRLRSIDGALLNRQSASQDVTSTRLLCVFHRFRLCCRCDEKGEMLSTGWGCSDADLLV